MHVLLTHEDGLSAPELGPIRDMLIMTGMSVVTMASAPPSDLQAGSLFTLQSADPDCNPVYGVSGPADHALAQALQQGLQAQICIVLSQDTADRADLASDSAALTAVRLGVPALNVRYSERSSKTHDAWISDLATEVVAMALTRPLPAAAMLVLTAPSRLRVRVPVLMPLHRPHADKPAFEPLSQRAHERDALAQGQVTLTPVHLDVSSAAEATDLVQWTQALAHTLHSRLSSPTMRCACCGPSFLAPISNSH